MSGGALNSTQTQTACWHYLKSHVICAACKVVSLSITKDFNSLGQLKPMLNALFSVNVNFLSVMCMEELIFNHFTVGLHLLSVHLVQVSGQFVNKLSGLFLQTMKSNLLSTASDRPVNADISSPQNEAPACICSTRKHA